MAVSAASSRVRIGVVGLGAVAQSVHLPLLARRWDLFEIVAIADLSPQLLEAVGTQYGVPASRRYLDASEMLAAGGLDGVLVLTSGSHGTPALQAIEAGVGVFCEKPLAFSLAEIERLEAAERAAGRPMLLLAYMKEYDPAVQRMKERIATFGPLRWAEVEVLHPSSASQLAFANLRPTPTDIDALRLAPLRARDTVAMREALGEAPVWADGLYANVVIGSLVHDISALRALVGGIRTVDSARQWDVSDEPGSLVVEGTIGEGARYAVHWHFMPDYPAYHERITLHFVDGSLRVEFAAPYLLNAPTVLTVVERDGVGERVSKTRDVTEAFETELVAFHRMLVERVAPPTGCAEGRADLITAQRILRSLLVHRGVSPDGEAARA